MNLGNSSLQLDVSGVHITCTSSGEQLFVNSYYPSSLADVARKGLRVDELVHTRTSVAGGPVMLMPYAVAVMSCAVPMESIRNAGNS